MKYKTIALSLLGSAGLLAGVTGQAASGADVSITVKDARGVPVRDAVVTIYPAVRTTEPIRFSWPNAMAQKDLDFVPGTLIVATGSSVTFPNFDRVRHSIYSFSKAAKFEISLYGRDQTRSRNFPITGTVAVGCNIHDNMRGYIKVVDTPYAAKTDRHGHVDLSGLPDGEAVVKIWHPLARAADNEASHGTTFETGANSRFVTLPVRGN